MFTDYIENRFGGMKIGDIEEKRDGAAMIRFNDYYKTIVVELTEHDKFTPLMGECVKRFNKKLADRDMDKDGFFNDLIFRPIEDNIGVAY